MVAKNYSINGISGNKMAQAQVVYSSCFFVVLRTSITESLGKKMLNEFNPSTFDNLQNKPIEAFR